MRKSIDQLKSERDDILFKPEREVVDWVQTGVSLGLVLAFIGLLIALIFFELSFINQLEDDNSRLIAFIVFMFATLKICEFIGYPKIYYKSEEVVR